jgi:hypothetical protein
LPRLFEQELFCEKCGKSRGFPRCCSQDAEYDGEAFFCPVCHKVLKYPSCCGEAMVIRKKVLDVKKQIFS